MSACYSGLADRSPLPGDDLFGLQRAMLQSGARTIVSGLWDVYDETGPLLMQGFFKQLTTGAAAPKALANSQRAFLKQHRADASDPWAASVFLVRLCDQRRRADQLQSIRSALFLKLEIHVRSKGAALCR